MPVPFARIIINPAAGGGLTRLTWPWLSAQLRKTGLTFGHTFTAGPGQAAEVAMNAAAEGIGLVVAVGGDGTVNEVANGIMRSGCAASVILGVIATGTSCGFARSFRAYYGERADLASPVAAIDLGVVEYRSGARWLKRYFLNEASAGIGAAVVKARNRLPSSLGRGVNLGLYTVAAYGTAVTYRDKRIQLECDGEAEDFYGSYVVAANGQYFADGMFIAPSARLDDGCLNLVTIGSITRARLQKLAMAAYRGEHLKFPEVREKAATSVAVECGEKLYVEADGELLGACPAAFSVIPSALKVTVLPELRSSADEWSRLIQRIKEQSGVPGVSTG